MTDRTDPFAVAVADDVLVDLADRLRHTRWPDQLPETSWEYGTDLGYLQELCGYWADGFDWRAVESRINGWPQGTAIIDGQSIHFIHARSDAPDALPLLVLHGWPGSIAEMLGVIEPLRNPGREGDDAGRRVPCRLCVTARFWVFRTDSRSGLAASAHCRRHGGAHGTSRLRLLRHPGR